MGGMRISQLAARSGVPVSTLRYYESEGLLPAARAANGYRLYGDGAVDRLAFISQAKSLSLSLAEIRELVSARDAEPCRAVRARYRPVLDRHADEVRARIDQLRMLESAIDRAQCHLDGLVDREASCDAACSFPGSPAVRAMPSGASMIRIDASDALACSLVGDGYTERVNAWRSLVGDVPHERIEGGVQFRLPVDRLEVATRLAVAEQRCCPFYRIGFDLHGSDFDLTVSAPSEAGEMLAELVDGNAP